MSKNFHPAKQIILICTVITVAFASSAIMFSVSSFKNASAYVEQITDMASTNIIATINTNISASLYAAKSTAESNSTLPKKLYDYLKSYCENRSILDLGSNYDVNVAFTDIDGNVVASNGYFITEGSNIFQKDGLFYNKDITLIPVESAITRIWLGSFWDTKREFCEVRYIKAFDRYLLVSGDGSGVVALHKKQLFLQICLISILLIFMLLIIIGTITRYRNKIIYLATMDELTKIMNRKSFMAKYELFASQNLLDGSHIFIIDIDFFKNINDTLGHAKGDETLYFLASSLASMVQNDGFIGRWGGDEFIGIFFPNVTDFLERLKAFSETISNSDIGKSLHLTLSIGIAELLPDKPLNKSLERADIALYASKEKGRNCITLYDENETLTDNKEF